MKGVYARTEEHKRNISLSMKGKQNRLSDNPGYRALHLWVNDHLPKPDSCEICKENKKLDLANITGLYNRDFVNWSYLCRKCHFNSDGRSVKFAGARWRLEDK